MNTNPELIKSIANNLSTLAVLLNNLAKEPEEKAKEEPKTETGKAEPKKPTLTELELRKKLGAYSIAGFTDTIREILKQHGVKLVKELKPEDYEAVLKEVQEACD